LEEENMNGEKKADVKKYVAISVCLVTAVVLFAGYHYAAAQGNERRNSPVSSSAPGSASPLVLSSSHLLFSSKFDQGDLCCTAVGSGFVAVDTAISFNCKNSAGCTIGAEHWLQVGGQTTSGNRWAICTVVDGTTQFLCPYQGYVPADGTYTTGSFNLSTPVAFGVHTVQEELYTDFGAVIGDYHNDYRLYKGQ
jgi:hypothetical protein